MAIRNQLFFIIFVPCLLGACGSQPRTGVNPASVRPATDAHVPSAVPQATYRAADTEVLFHALLASGVDYRRGGRSQQSGFDCSGLVAHVYRQAYGLALPHGTQAQSELGETVGRAELRPGDLVFFNTLGKPYSHVGIYVGDGRFIHAPKEGAVVRTESLQARYWSSRFDGARRIADGATAAAVPSSTRPVPTRP